MTKYYRVMLGKGSAFADECFEGNFIGTYFDVPEDLSAHLPDEWREFNKRYIPLWLTIHPGKSKIAAGLACGFTWTVAKGVRQGDVVLCPDGHGAYRVGEVIGEYRYLPGQHLPHQRPVRWMGQRIDRTDMSEALRNSAGAIGTVSDVSRYVQEIEALLGGRATASVVATDPNIEDPSMFALEEHLEEFLVKNWAQTLFGKDYDIFEEDGEKTGQQYATDTGPLDILAIRKDKKELLVLELKKGRTSDAVVGQVLRHMGYVLQELAEDGQAVKGAIIAHDDDPRIRRALAATSNVDFYRYQVSFRLLKI